MRTRHSHDEIFDGARHVVVRRGIRNTTLEAIAEQCQAPIGSIYHRFDSVDELLARLWLRAARRSQAIVLSERTEEPVEWVVGGGLAIYDHCLRDPEDAVLLASFRPQDFSTARLEEDLRKELEGVNAPVDAALAETANQIFGSRAKASVDLLLLALAGLPYSFARRAGKRGRRDLRARLEACIRALLRDPETGL